MKPVVRSLAVGGAAAACAATLVLPTDTPTPTELLAQAFYMRGTKIGNDVNVSDEQYEDVANGFVRNSVCLDGANGDVCSNPIVYEKIDYPAEFWPLSDGGITAPTYGESVAIGVDNVDAAVPDSVPVDNRVLLYGYSQSAVVLSLYMRDHLDQNIVYVLVSNPMRPNGGILQRFSFLGEIPILNIPLSGATPTSGAPEAEGFAVYDIAQQYDGWADFPTNPLNVLATVNAIMGIAQLHGQYALVDEESLSDPTKGDTWEYGDTTYYTTDTPLLPLLMPLETAGVPRSLLMGFDAPLRVLVEAGYDRETNPGEPTGINIFYGPDPITLATNFFTAIPVGIDDGLEYGNGLDRPLGTEEAGMYGVGVEENDGVNSTTAPAPFAAEQSLAAEPSAARIELTEEPDDETADDDGELEESGAHSLNTSPNRLRVRDLLGDNSVERSENGPRHASGRPLRDIVNRVLGRDDDDQQETADDDDDDDDDNGASDDNNDSQDSPSDS